MLRHIGLRQAFEAGCVSQEAVDWYLALLRDTDTMRNELSAGPRFPLRGMDDRVLLPVIPLAKIHTPLHFLWGEEDPFGGADIAGPEPRRSRQRETPGHRAWTSFWPPQATLAQPDLDPVVACHLSRVGANVIETMAAAVSAGPRQRPPVQGSRAGSSAGG